MSDESKAPHPYLTGIHQPLDSEVALFDLPVTGTIPLELQGRYVRIGPNSWSPQSLDQRAHHWFLGDGMVHGLRLEGGNARWYRNRWIRSQALEERGGPAAVPGPRRGINDTVNTNVMKIGSKNLALVEAGSYPVELSDDLESVCYTNFQGTLAGPFSAHPHRDPLTGEFHAISYDVMDPTRLTHVVVGAGGVCIREMGVSVEHGPSVHDCGLTENYVVIFDLPVTFSLDAIAKGESYPFKWNTNHQARVGLLPRRGNGEETIWCEVEPCYVFHVANSFELIDGIVVVDAMVYATMFEEGAGPNGKSMGFERWLIDPKTRRVQRTTIDPTPLEFPRIDERFFSKPHKFAWSIGIPGLEDPQKLSTGKLYRHDLATRSQVVFDFGATAQLGEFTFVPRAPGALEGDGWVMGFVLNVTQDKSDLVILPSDLTRIQARIHLPHRIPPGFHGNWLSDDMFSSQPKL